MKIYYVYILASKRNGTLYVGVTGDLFHRVMEHKQGIVPGLTKKYGVKILVYFEEVENIYLAIQREKSLKRWKRSWKLKLIEGVNPLWKDLYDDLI